MKPTELFDLCIDAIERFNRGEVYADEPFIMLVLPHPGKYCGRTIRLYGKTGPRGQVATAKERDGGGLDVVAYFPAIKVLESLGDVVGVKVKVKKCRKS